MSQSDSKPVPKRKLIVPGDSRRDVVFICPQDHSRDCLFSIEAKNYLRAYERAKRECPEVAGTVLGMWAEMQRWRRKDISEGVQRNVRQA